LSNNHNTTTTKKTFFSFTKGTWRN